MSNLRVPLVVRSLVGDGRVDFPVWAGLPLPRSAVADASALRLLDAAGEPVPAQFDVLNRWADGSCRWVLVSLIAQPQADREGQYTVVADPAVAASAVAASAVVTVDTNSWVVNTGPLRFFVNRQGFRGLHQVQLDADGRGFDLESLICPDDPAGGLWAVDESGVAYSSADGRVHRIELERAGPIHACVAVHGDLRSRRGEVLLDYAMRIHAFAGLSLLRVVVTIRNSRPAARPEDGARWVLGQAGRVLLKSLDYVLPVRLDQGQRRLSVSPEPGRLIERIPLTAQVGKPVPPSAQAGKPVPTMEVYQDSSGGENWFHRTHTNAEGVIPVSFRGYELLYHGRAIERGQRATPWIELADFHWAAALTAGRFWQNFPKSLAVEPHAAGGALRLGLWPGRFGDLHEIQGGEQKTHEFWLYLRHRRRGGDAEADPRDESRRMPMPHAVMPLCQNRPTAWATPEAYSEAGFFEPVEVAAATRHVAYEAAMSAAIRDQVDLFAHRERADEYGWRHFGDTPAYNEIERTQGPYDGSHVVSHYNNEYDLGLGMMLQAVRNLQADPAAAARWHELAMDALWHEADIDIYHTQSDPAPVYNGGTFIHTAHAVDADTSTHRGSPRDEVWGKLDWPWRRGTTPEAGHLRNAGILHAYLLGGDAHLLEAGMELAHLVAFKIRRADFAQIDVADRGGGNNLQILTDAFLMTRDRQWLELGNVVVKSLDFAGAFERLGDRLGWSCAIYVKALSRFVDVLAEAGEDTGRAVAELLAYGRAIRENGYRDNEWKTSAWGVLLAEVMMQSAQHEPDPAERARYVEAARAAFAGVGHFVRPDGTGRFINSKVTTILLQNCPRCLRQLE